MARNIILSGWLIYPFAGVDLFSFDWKIPKGEVLYDAAEIKVYAKGMTDVLLKDLAVKDWIPNWFSGLKGLEKIWILSSLGSLGLGVFAIIGQLWKKQKEFMGLVFLELVLIFGYLFWQIGTPLVRYGYIYILAFPFFTIGMYYVRLWGTKKRGYVFFGILLLAFFGYKGGNLVKDIRTFSNKDCYVYQQDYETGTYESYEIDGVEFYVPLEYGQIGYEKFPSAPTMRYDVRLRGERLKDGFQRK